MAIYNKIAKAEGGGITLRVRQLKSQTARTRIRHLKLVLGQIWSVLQHMGHGVALVFFPTVFTLFSNVTLCKRNLFVVCCTEKIPIRSVLHFSLSSSFKVFRVLLLCCPIHTSETRHIWIHHCSSWYFSPCLKVY